MKYLLKTVLAVSAVIVLSGCASGMQPVSGALFSDVKGPFDVSDLSFTPTKTGKSMAKSYVGLIGIGDASIESAMKDGGIKQVHHVDYHTTSILGLYAETTIIVYGK